MNTRILSVFRLLKRVGFACLFCVQVAVFGQWTQPELLRPPINVDPPGSYYYSTISADGQVLCMTIFQGAQTDDDVYISERINDSTWTTPVNAGPNVNNAARNLSPSITSDRQRLYYVNWTGASYDFFVSYRTGPNWDDWTVGEALPEPINRGREFTGQISFDDSTLVFTSTGQPGHFGDAMFTSRLQPDSSWSEPVRIAAQSNGLNFEAHPCLTDSGRTLVYGRGFGTQFDIYYSQLTDSGFATSQRCDSTINSPYWDYSPSCPADGRYLIFDSRRTNPSGAAQLYQARRVFSPVEERPNYPRNGIDGQVKVSPSIGSSGTDFYIQLPPSSDYQSIRIYDILGQVVHEIPLTFMSGQPIIWKGTDYESQLLPSGIYFVTARNEHNFIAKKVVLTN